MENENKEIIIDSPENNENKETIIDSPENNEGKETIIDPPEDNEENLENKKPQETLEARLARLERQANQIRKKIGVKNEKKPVETKKEPKSDDFDYGQKAFLRSYDIKGADEIALVKNWVRRTGDELDVMVEDEIFQAKIKSLREAKATAEATPKGTKRINSVGQNDEQYWIAKLESGQATLRDITDVEIRRKVLNKRIEQEKSGSKFSQKSVIMT